MNKRYRKLGFFTLSILVFTLVPVPVSANSDGQYNVDQSFNLHDNPYATPEFSSHLPLIVIEFKGKDELDYTALESNWLEDDWFNHSVISVYDNTDGRENNLQGEPNLAAIAKIQMLADWETENREKHDYYVRLEDGDGQVQAHEQIGRAHV